MFHLLPSTNSSVGCVVTIACRLCVGVWGGGHSAIHVCRLCFRDIGCQNEPQYRSTTSTVDLPHLVLSVFGSVKLINHTEALLMETRWQNDTTLGSTSEAEKCDNVVHCNGQ